MTRRGMVVKANKVLKRIAKIEALMSKVTERSSARATQIRKLFRDAKAAVPRAKEAVQASSGAPKKGPVKHSEPTSKASTPETSKPKRKLSRAGRAAIVAATKARWDRVRAEAAKTKPVAAKKTAVKWAAVKTAPAKAAKKSAPSKKATVKKGGVKKTTPVAGGTATEAAA